MANVSALFAEIVADDDLLNDRRQYSHEDLAQYYDLTAHEAERLFDMIREYMNSH